MALEKAKDLKENSVNTGACGNSSKNKISVFGQEMIEKKVKARGKTGRVYLPPGWVGKIVKVIRID